MINLGLKKLRRWWQVRTGRYDTPIDGEVPFWVVSLCINILLLGLLAKLILPETDFRRKMLVVGEHEELIDVVLEETFPPEVEFSDLNIDELSTESDEQLEIITERDTPLINIAIQRPLAIEVPTHDFGELTTESSFAGDPVETLSNAETTGSVGNTVTGASGAVDRLTKEILRSLEDNATMVVWLFDQSASLTRQRAEIEGRIDRIYRELNLLESAKAAEFEKDEDQPLLTHVYAFGKQVSPVLKRPTNDVKRIKSAIAGIERDSSGIENVFTAVMRCVKDFSDYRRIDRSTGQRKRNVMLIVLCDEAGDDGDRADEAIKSCEKFAIPVYVIGVPAPFGRAETRVKWVDPDPQYDQRPQVALVSQGPESVMPERLNLDFIGGDFEDLEMIDSGFGPYHLTRLCYQTGGIYFAVHPNRRKGRVSFAETDVYSSDLRYFFDPEVMRRYLPDYVSINEYRTRIKDNRSRAALVQAASIPKTEQLVVPAFRFPKLDEAEFVRQVSDAQRAAAILQPRLDRLYEILIEGELDREKEASPRWQAGFDLAIGRVIAARLRAKSYNEMLALSKTGLRFEDPNNNTWVLRPSRSLSATGSQNEKLAEKANEYLTRIVDEHPDTPWALLAQRELSTPFGWKWKESYTPPPPPPQPQPNVVNNNNPRNPQPQPNRQPKELRPIPKL